MPKGNGDAVAAPHQTSSGAGQEHGECRKAMETPAAAIRAIVEDWVRNTVNAERQWRHRAQCAIRCNCDMSGTR